MGGKLHAKEDKHNTPGELSTAPIQGLTALQQAQRLPVSGARPGQWSLMTANTTNWMGAKTLITALGRDPNPRRPTFIVLQEHRNAEPDDCKRAEDWSRINGYNLSFAPAASTGLGKLNTSGGVAVGALQHIGIAKDIAFQQHFAKHKGRIHAVVCNCLFPRGVLLVGAYWKSGLDMNMLRRLANHFLECGRPWMLACDWNVPPQVLINTCFIAKTGGHLRAQLRNTCEMGKGSNIDYVVLCNQMAAKYFSDYLWGAGPIAPHHPYFINFCSAAEEPTYRHRTKPKAFPVHAPIGCQRAPLTFMWANPAVAIVPDLAAAWKEWVTNAETALCHRFDMDLQGEARRYKGRSRGLTLTWRTLRSKPTPQHSSISDATLKWRGLKALSRQADNILSAAEEVYSCTACEQLMARITSHRTCQIRKCAIQGCQRCRRCGWVQCPNCLQAQNYAPIAVPRMLSTMDQQQVATCLRQITKIKKLQLPEDLGGSTANLADRIFDATASQRQGIIQSITERAIRSTKKDKIAASKSWKLKAQTMTEKGAAAAHKYIKKPKGMDQHIQSNGLPQVGQEAVKALEEQWRPLWQAPGRRLAPHEGAPEATDSHSPATQPRMDFQKFYRRLDGYASPLPQLPPIVLQRLIEVLGTYKAFTGL